MDSTIVTVALPSLSRQFNAPGTSIDAVIVGYLVSLAIIIPASGWLGDRLGTKRIFLAALALFTLASALCGLASSLPMLIGFRVLQGIGGGAMTPVGTAILSHVPSGGTSTGLAYPQHTNGMCSCYGSGHWRLAHR